MSALAAHYIRFDGHQMQVVAVDSVSVKATSTDTIKISAAQRYDVIITGRAKADKNYAFVASSDPDMFDTVPPTLNMNSDGILVYDAKAPTPTPIRNADFSDALDDFFLVPLDHMEALSKPSREIVLSVNFTDFSVGARAALGSTPYIAPKVPTLFTALTTGQQATNPAVYGVPTNPYVLKRGEIVQIVLNNPDDGGHPFHLHGHQFQVMSRTNTQPWTSDTTKFPRYPMRRDTVKVPPSGSIVLRFRADNPGVYLFHCHIDWHVSSGLSVTFIEDPIALQKQYPNGVPFQQQAICRSQRVPTVGNCAGNTRNYLDTSQCIQQEQFDPSPYGSLIQY